MTEDQYIEHILGKYSVSYGKNSPAVRVLGAIKPDLRHWAGIYIN